jgi:hypothetical protein
MDSRKSTLRHITRTCVLYRVESADLIVHSAASGMQNVDVLFFILRSDRYGFHKKCIETRYNKLVFCIRWDLWVR